MFTMSARRRLLASTIFAGALVATPALAQTAATDNQPAPTAGAAAPSGGDEIVVTGSLFRRTTTETPSPVTVLTADAISRAAITTAADAIRSISADSAGSIGTGFQTGFSAGGSAVSLRGLGVSSTLVLVDGLRSTNFPINDDGRNAYVDLNSIPFSLIDRIEVLKDGASATYGADAIGGVVNLILKKQFTGVSGTVEGGISQRGDAARQRANLTIGYGDYATQGWNVYLNGEYQHDGRVSNKDRGFPFNTLDLTSVGGNDNNPADSSLVTQVPTAYVIRAGQTDLNNPLSGSAAPLGTTYTALGLQNCQGGTFTIATGTGCKYDLTDRYRQLQPLQERYSLNGRLSVRISDTIEGYVTGSYSRSDVSITTGFSPGLRNNQPFGGSPTTSSLNPGIVLPYFVCSAGVNCATAADRRLNPNNPFATNAAATPAIAQQNAARIYYLFGDIPSVSNRVNEVYRGTAGLTGTIGDAWDWRVEGVYARDNLKLEQRGFLKITNLLNAINTGAYDFVNPQNNSQAVRSFISPNRTTPSFSELYSLDASVTRKLFALPGGDLQLAVGGQIRHEELENNNQNADLSYYGLTTSSAFGKRTVKAAYFELSAPVLDQLELSAAGRYDDYSAGYHRFSPKFGFKFTPIKEVALRGTYTQGFRAPTFAESGPRSQYAGFVSTTPPCAFQLTHGATGTATACNANGNPYNNAYQLGRGVAGNPAISPEKSRSFTGGIIFQPVRWLSLTADYYNIKKRNLIVAGPDVGKATAAYYAQTNLAAATAAVAAIGQGYSVNLTDAPDPLFQNALPRVLIINVPFVNANFFITSGIDVSATATVPLGDSLKLTSKVEVSYIQKANLHTTAGVQKYAGTLGPYDLSSGNGTPRWRGNWQNTLDLGAVSLSATAYYVGKIKAVSTDQQSPPFTTDCSAALYKGPSGDVNQFCYIKRFINVDSNVTVRVSDDFRVFLNVLNVFDVKAPLAAAAYTSAPNYLTTWHSAGALGRMFRAGASFNF